MDKINFASLTNFDIAVLTLIALSVLFGLFRGLVRSFISFAGWIISFLLAVQFAYYLVPVFAKYTSSNTVAEVVSTFALFLMIAIVIAIINGVVFAMTSAISGGMIDRSLGLLFGFARGCAMVSLIFYFMVMLLPSLNVENKEDVNSDNKKIPSWAKGSESLFMLSKGAKFISQYMPTKFEQKLKQSSEESKGNSKDDTAKSIGAVGSINKLLNSLPKGLLDKISKDDIVTLQNSTASYREKIRILEDISDKYQHYNSQKVYYGASKEQIKKFNETYHKNMKMIESEIKEYNVLMYEEEF